MCNLISVSVWRSTRLNFPRPTIVRRNESIHSSWTCLHSWPCDCSNSVKERIRKRRKRRDIYRERELYIYKEGKKKKYKRLNRTIRSVGMTILTIRLDRFRTFEYLRALLGILVRLRIRELVFNCVELITGGSEPKKKRKIKQNRENKKFVKKCSWQRGVCQRYLKGAREKRMKNKFNIKQMHKYIKNEYMNINIKQIYIY